MNQTVTIVNKSAGRVAYNLPELNNLHREFAPHETRKGIAVSELEQLAQTRGGRVLLTDYLQVQDKEVITYLLNGSPEPEYWLNDADIPSWIASCTLDEFKDALDFAPEGTKDLIKEYAVSTKLNDFSKREAIREQLGFDVTKAIDMMEPAPETTEKATRRVAVTSETPVAQPARRVVSTQGDKN